MQADHLHDAFTMRHDASGPFTYDAPTMCHDAWGAFEHLVKWCEHLNTMQPVGHFTETDFVFLYTFIFFIYIYIYMYCTKTNEHKQEDRYKQCLSNMTEPLIDTWIILIIKYHLHDALTMSHDACGQFT